MQRETWKGFSNGLSKGKATYRFVDLTRRLHGRSRVNE